MPTPAKSVELVNAQPVSRRQFAKRRALAAIAVPAIVRASALGTERQAPASDRIQLGFVGLGAQGFGNLRAFIAQPDAQVVAVCDVDRLHYRDQPWGTGQAFGREPIKQFVDDHYAKHKTSGQFQGCAAHADFRELCARPDLDAVVISTPDHWHALVTIEALRSGKDVYCEKPVTHFFAEGQRIVAEVAQRKAVFQTGSQQRSMPLFRQAVELVRNGHLGQITRVEVGLPDGYDEPQGDPTITRPPEGVDYDLWCGPGPALPYMRARHHRWWRGHRGFGGGTLMDWIGHHNDIAHWSLDLDRGGPVRVEARGWQFPKTDIYNTPAHFEIVSNYANGVEISICDRYDIGTKWIGEQGWLFVDRGKMRASDPRWTKADFPRGPITVEASTDHQHNFLACVKSRGECIAPARVAHRSITPGHLGYVAQQVGRPLRWDAERETVLDDSEAAVLLAAAEYRAPWVL